MSNEAQVRSQVREMAKLSILSNKINEIQEKNLLMFPKVFFEGVLSGSIDYDFSCAALVDTTEDKRDLKLEYFFNKVDTKHFRVSYHLKIDETKAQEHLDQRFAAIEQSVRTLFFKDVKVEVFFNDRLVFESKDGR